MANRRYIDFPIASSVGDSDIILIWQSGANKQTTKATFLSGLPENLDELNDVAISGLTNGQILRYDSVTGKWENTDQGNLDLNDLNDVSIVSPSNGQVLVYNSSTSRWENSSGGYVPYTGAVTTVNLGSQTIQAGQFVKVGGTAAQFLKANGSVDSTAYGTGSVTSVALTMPTAFSVAGSPITTAGTLAVTGAGTVGQYIRGDGSLADFPESSGGGSSVSYYLNGSVAQGTIGGVAYKELNKVPILGAGTDFTINANGYIASFITDAGDPNLLEIPAGNWNFETYFSASSGGGSPSFYVELYKVNSGGTATLIASNSTFPELIAFGTNVISYFSTLAVPTTALALTDRLAIRYYVIHSGRTITLHTEDNHLCQIITTFTTGITALNGLTAQVQNFAVGTTGTDFNIASATATHTFNLPDASATARGVVTTGTQTFAGAKTLTGNLFFTGTAGIGNPQFIALSKDGSNTAGLSSYISFLNAASTDGILAQLNASNNLSFFGRTSSVNSAIVATISRDGNITGNSFIKSGGTSTQYLMADGSVSALTNPVTGTGDSGTLPKFTGASTIGNSLFTDNGTNGAFGGANYFSGTDLRTFNISAPLYAGLAFWANNQNVGNIIGFGVTGNLILNADQSNLFADTKIILSIDDTERFAIFNDGNVTIANSPINESFKLYVSGTGKFSSNLTANSFIKIGGTSSQFLKADGSVDSTTYVPTSRTITINGTTQDLSADRTYNVGTVTSVTASSPLFSSGGTTPNLTIQQASGSQNGFLSSTDWTTFNNKAPSVAGGYLPLSGGTLTGNLNLKSDGGGVPLYIFGRNSDNSSAIFFYNETGVTLQNYILSSPTDFRIVSQQNGPISFVTNAASSTIADMSITADGNVNISNGNLVIGTAGKGVDFGINTGAAGKTSQLLDDYEEGTWTPTVIGGVTPGTYTLSGIKAYYTKIGNQVTIWASFGFSAASGGTNYIRIGGAPFSYKANSAVAGAILAGQLNTSASSSNGLILVPDTGGSNTTFYPRLSIDNADPENIAIGAVSTSTTFQFTITYTVS